MRTLSQKEKVRAYDALKLVEKFNNLYPIGSTVMIRKVSKDSYPYIPVTVSTFAFVANETEPVTFFNEISGYFSIEPEFVQYPEDV